MKMTLLLLLVTVAMTNAQGDCELFRSQGIPGNEYRVECQRIRYIIVAPAACLNTSCPMLFDVHGFSMTGDGQATATNLRTLGYNRGYIVVNPEKPTRNWIPSQDHELIFDFFDQMVDVYDVNQSRTHFTGFSQGGLSTWGMACERSLAVCSVAPLAASALDSWGFPASEDCWQTAPTSPGLPPRIPDILYVSGYRDRLAPFDNAEDRRDDVLQLYGLNYNQGTVISQDSNHLWTRWTRPQGGEIFEFMEHDFNAYGGVVGHCVPYAGNANSGDGPFVCRNNPSPFNWGDIVLDFFDANPC